MPLKVTFELSDEDLRFFAKKASVVTEQAANKEERELIGAAEKLVDNMAKESTPAFVTERVGKLRQMVDMLRDDLWQLAGQDRERVLKAIAYFAEPEDLIPDELPTIGFIDDAVMIELVVRELRHELEAYDDFCKVQKSRRRVATPTDREAWTALRRKQLQERMRRRRRRDRKSGTSGSGKVFSLF
jgi:uncharacterized membrane protein YkvA (DUF1232 family)